MSWMSSIARERARKIASKNRSSTTTGIGGSFQLANSAPPLGVTGSASAPTARMGDVRRDGACQCGWELRGEAGDCMKGRCDGLPGPSVRVGAGLPVPSVRAGDGLPGPSFRASKRETVSQAVVFSLTYYRYGSSVPWCVFWFRATLRFRLSVPCGTLAGCIYDAC